MYDCNRGTELKIITIQIFPTTGDLVIITNDELQPMKPKISLAEFRASLERKFITDSYIK